MSPTVPPASHPPHAARASSHDDPDRTLPVPLPAAPAASELPSPPAAVPVDLSGHRLGAWTLCRKIGHGGMGEVWLAERSDGLFQAQAAIKLLRSDLPAQQLAARFARERALLARLDHPAIARLLDAGVDQGRAYLVLEYVQGMPLAEHVRQHCPDVASRVRLMVQVAEAVDHAHARLVVHRDLKPANVLVSADGTPKLLDFGIAGMLGEDDLVDGQLTRLTGRRVTLAYAAPEQVTGEPVGVTADVFSLGVMLFQLLSGDMPFGSESSSRVAAEHALLHDEAPRLARSRSGASSAPRSALQPVDPQRVRGDLEAIVAKALRKRPADRYGSMRVLIDDLQRWLDHRPVSVRRDDWRHRAGLWLQRNAVAAAAGAALLLALSVGLAASLWQWQRAEAAARTAQAVTNYLGELLSSAQPDRHSGQVPTVMQLLESSRQDLSQRFADSPATQERLLEVLGQTYLALNRSDLALPLARQRVATAAALDGGTGRRSLLARLDLARILAMREAFDQVVATAEPLRRDLPRRLGEHSDEHRNLLYVLAYAHVRLSRFDEGRTLMEQARRVTEAMYPPGDFQRLFHFNHVQVLEVSAGRLRQGLAALQQTEPHWDAIPAEQQRSRHTLERNMIAVQIRLGEYEGLLDRGTALLHRIDALMGTGSDQAAGLRAELARGLTETGRYAEAWMQRQAVLDQAPGGLAARQPAQTLPERAQALLARALAQPQAAAALNSQARALMDELERQVPDIGVPGLEARAALLRAALVLGDRALAASAVRALRGDSRLAGHRTLRSRVDQLEGALRRWQGDLEGSRSLLQARADAQLDLVETRTPRTWSALLDLATTLTDLRDPAAARVLQRANQVRPTGMPGDVPLDRLHAWLEARLRHGDDRAAPVRRAWSELARRVGREPGAPRSMVLAATVF
jgi:serine/threonine-protein kinase